MGVDIVVDTGEDFRVKAFVFGDHERVLACTVETEAEIVVEEIVPGVAESDVVTAEERCVLHKVAAAGEFVGGLFEQIRGVVEIGERQGVVDLFHGSGCLGVVVDPVAEA